MFVTDIEKTILRSYQWEYTIPVISKNIFNDSNSCPAFVTPEQWGRIDNEDCSAQTDEQFPNPNMNYEGMMTYFKKQLNFDDDEVS